MAKRGKYQPDRMQEPTCKPTQEQLTIRRWFMDLDLETRCELIRQTRGMGTKETGEYYCQLWIDAGSLG